MRNDLTTKWLVHNLFIPLFKIEISNCYILYHFKCSNKIVFFVLFTFRFVNMSSLSLRSILETEKLVGANYDDWYRNLRIILMHEKLIDTIEKPAVTAPTDPNDVESTKAHDK